MTIWGVFSGDVKAQANRVVSRNGETISEIKRTYSEEHPRVMLLYAWQERLELHDLIKKIVETTKKIRGIDTLLIENKATGISVAQELRRVYSHEDFGVQLVDPKGLDKLARMYSIQHLFSEGLIYAPERSWADDVIRQCEVFPKGKHDDLVDTVSLGLKHLRELGLLVRKDERLADVEDQMTHRGSAPPPLYMV
jgi:hypothetical protein